MLDGLGFGAQEVANMLGYRDSTRITRRLEDFERHTHKVEVAKSTGFIEKREMAFINESGLWKAIFDSRKPEAKKMRVWVSNEVMPSIRVIIDAHGQVWFVAKDVCAALGLASSKHVQEMVDTDEMTYVHRTHLGLST